jgi:chromosomal replication initiator protein
MERRVTIGDVVAEASRYFNVSTKDLLSRSLQGDRPWRRQIVMYLARNMTGRSWPAIARKMQLNHSTVMSGYQVIAKRLEQGDASTIIAVDEISRRVLGHYNSIEEAIVARLGRTL